MEMNSKIVNISRRDKEIVVISDDISYMQFESINEWGDWIGKIQKLI